MSKENEVVCDLRVQHAARGVELWPSVGALSLVRPCSAMYEASESGAPQARLLMEPMMPTANSARRSPLPHQLRSLAAQPAGGEVQVHVVQQQDLWNDQRTLMQGRQRVIMRFQNPMAHGRACLSRPSVSRHFFVSDCTCCRHMRAQVHFMQVRSSCFLCSFFMLLFLCNRRLHWQARCQSVCAS